MRILHVINGLTTGGAETVLYRLATYPSEVEHEVICLEERAWFSERLEAKGIKVHHLNWKAAGARAAITRLDRLIRRSDAQLVQAWMYRSNVFAGLSAWKARKPIVWNIRCSTTDIYPLPTRALARLGGLLARRVPERIINCSAASAQLHAQLGYPLDRVVVIPNGFDSDRLKPDPAARSRVRKSLGVDPETLLLGTIGRWHKQKGIPQLLAAFRRLRDKGVDAKLLLVGRELDQENVELGKLIRDSGADDDVITVGERDDVANFACALDVHVLASLGGEGFPNAVGESMLTATPNIVTDVGDSSFVVGESGWVVPAADVSALAEAMGQAHQEFKGEPEKWERRRKAARARIEEQFSLAGMVHSYLKLWNETIGDAAVEKTPAAPAGAIVDRDKRVTIAAVIPVYNKAGAVEDTLRSVLRQTRPPDEFIVVDDGSTDGSAQIVRRLLEEESSIPYRVITQPNSGVSEARNRGAREAKAEYVAFLDGDDEWLPECLAEFERLATAFPAAGLLSVRVAKTVVGHSKPVRERSALDNFFGEVANPIAVYRKGYGLICSSSVAVRKSALLEVGGFPTGAKVGEDIYCWLRLMMRERMAHSSRALSIWREEFTGVEARLGDIPYQISYFLGSGEARRFLDNRALVRFLASNLAVQIAIWRQKGDADVLAELRRFASALPLGSRGFALMVANMPLWALRRMIWFRRNRRRLFPVPAHSAISGRPGDAAPATRKNNSAA